jgi:Mg-chelatase subunit ChlD
VETAIRESEATATVIQSATETELKALDLIVVIDHSGSMGDPSLRLAGKAKFEELKEDVIAVAREMGKYDADGLTVIAFSSAVRTFDGVTADKVGQVFTETSPRGTTNLTDAMKAVSEKAKSTDKEVVAVIYTDGSPDDPESAMKAIAAIGTEMGRPKIGLVFVQVGADPGAAAFLSKLDNEMPVDVCATVSAAQAEGLSVGQLVWLARNK